MTNKTVTFNKLTHKIVPIEPDENMCRALFINLAHADSEKYVLRKVILAAPEYQESSQWISVGEQLPPKCIDVLCQPFLSFSNVAWHDGACWRVTEYIKGFGETHTALEDGFITHWMPLPPAPEGV